MSTTAQIAETLRKMAVSQARVKLFHATDAPQIVRSLELANYERLGNKLVALHEQATQEEKQAA